MTVANKWNRMGLVFILYSILSIVIFQSTLSVFYTTDDLSYYRVEGSVLRYFFEPLPGNAYYRPLNIGVAMLGQTLMDDNPFFIHFVNLIAHISLATFVYWAATRLDFSPMQAALSGGLMLVGQNAVLPLGNVDATSQIFAALFGTMSLWFVYRAFDQPTLDRRAWWWSLFFLLLGFLSKEAIAGIMPLIFFIILIQALRHTEQPVNWSQLIPKVAMQYVPYFIFFVAYYLLRQMIVGSGGVDMSLGPHIIENTAYAGIFLSNQFSTYDLFVAFDQRNYLMLAFYGGLIVIFWGTVLYGIWRADSRDRGYLLLALVASMIVLTPVLLATYPYSTSGLSELYIYSSLPFLTLACGYSVGHLWDLAKARHLRALLVLFIAVFMATNIVGSFTKSAKANEVGEASKVFLDHSVYAITHLDPAMTILVIDNTTDEEGPFYAVFAMSSRHILDGIMDRVINQERYYENTPPMYFYNSARGDRVIESVDPEFVFLLNMHSDGLYICDDPLANRACVPVTESPDL